MAQTLLPVLLSSLSTFLLAHHSPFAFLLYPVYIVSTGRIEGFAACLSSSTPGPISLAPTVSSPRLPSKDSAITMNSTSAGVPSSFALRAVRLCQLPITLPFLVNTHTSPAVPFPNLDSIFAPAPLASTLALPTSPPPTLLPSVVVIPSISWS